jgi:hypothetical protein
VEFTRSESQAKAMNGRTYRLSISSKGISVDLLEYDPQPAKPKWSGILVGDDKP